MTTIATDGKSMAGDGQCQDQFDTITNMDHVKVVRLKDGRIVGGAGNSFDFASWIEWLEGGKINECPIEAKQFVGLILNRDGSVLWVDHKGREAPVPTPCAVGSGQQYALGAMHAGATPEQAVAAGIAYDVWSGGFITVESL